MQELTGNNWRVIVADVIAGLQSIPEESVQCCITSPPYYNLRDYQTASWEGGNPDCDHLPPNDAPNGNKGQPTIHAGRHSGDCRKCGAIRVDHQIGLEKTPEEFIARMVGVFREVRRVLRDDGVLFVNMGDSYAGSWGNYGGQNRGRGSQREIVTGSQAPNPAYDGLEAFRPAGANGFPGIKPKDLIGVPWMLAFALRADGWYLRSAMPWVKRSTMPESINDRPASALEYVFQFAKSPRYFFDMEAVRKASSPATHARLSQNVAEQIGSERANGGGKTNGTMKAVCAGSTRKLAEAGSGTKTNGSFDAAMAIMPTSRNFRNADLWFESVSQPFGLCGVEDELIGIDATSEGYSESHFATFPSKLVRPLIKAGTSEKGCCSNCGAPWQRVTERRQVKRERPNDITKRDGSDGTGNHCGNTVAGVAVQTKGWQPTCECVGAEIVPCTVLDCFSGSGTTGMVATELGRRYIGCELNPDYAEMSRRRIESWKHRDAPKAAEAIPGQLELF